MQADSRAALTQNGWGWTRGCGCGPQCLESSCSAAYTRSCSLWSQPGAEEDDPREKRHVSTGWKRQVEGQRRMDEDENKEVSKMMRVDGAEESALSLPSAPRMVAAVVASLQLVSFQYYCTEDTKGWMRALLHLCCSFRRQ